MWQKAKNLYHLAIAIVANVFYGFPAKKLIVVGITGTDGKTTTASLVYHILKSAQKNASLISTVAAYIDDKTYDTGFHVTNPSSIPLQQFIKKIIMHGKEKKENYLVLEVTSHGIDQNRIWGIPFEVAGLTNITHEHLDYHKSYENYLKTKTKLLQKAKIAIVNKDDNSFSLVSKILKANKKHFLTYALENGDVNLKTVPFQSKLQGIYNKYNCILAVAICKYLGISDKDIQKGIETFTLPIGRAEIAYDKDFTVMVDFAHTPNAIEQVLATVRPKVKGRLIHVFGSAGLRDATKRPLMGKAAALFDDVIIMTAEDPRTEKVEKINKQIRSGIYSTNSNIELLEIPDRQKAITSAISLARKGDFVVITGKGHEQSINYGHGEESWSDFEAVKNALRLRSES